MPRGQGEVCLRRVFRLPGSRKLRHVERKARLYERVGWSVDFVGDELAFQDQIDPVLPFDQDIDLSTGSECVDFQE